MFKGNNKNKVNSVNDACLSSVFTVNFEHISHLFSNVSIIDFKQAIVSWVFSLNQMQ